MLNHYPFTYKVSPQFIKCIKEDTYLFEKTIKFYKKFKELYVKINEATIIKHCTYINLGEDKEKLPSDVINNIIIKTYKGVVSYYAKRKKGLVANKPRYLSPEGKYILPYFCRSFKKLDTQIRLTAGKFIANSIEDIIGTDKIEMHEDKYYYIDSISKTKKDKNYIILDKNKYLNKNNLLDANFMYLYMNKKIRKETIKLIEIVPEHGRYKVCITYDDNEKYPKVYNYKNKTEEELAKVSISADLGIDNLMAVYDPNGSQILIKGTTIVGINKKYKKMISNLQSLLSKNTDNEQMKKGIKMEIGKLWIKREQEIEGYFNRLVDGFCKNYENKKVVIIGYNEYWKQKVNLGRKTNEKFYSIPYCKLLKKLKTKLNSMGIQMIKTEESYTSKCDALTLEKICEHSKYRGSREGRLFYSTEKIINADINGAINIMRKKIKLTKVRGKNICNPICRDW